MKVKFSTGEQIAKMVKFEFSWYGRLYRWIDRRVRPHKYPPLTLKDMRDLYDKLKKEGV